ncbi:MAG: hypothetical protein MI861_00620 [Pirellulales bacterium]|nr:hypothetical protein [Pirellulales bacterium]
MKRHLQLRQSITTQRFNARSWAIEMPVAASDVVPLVCEISLLLCDRSDQLSLLFDKGKKLMVSVAETSLAISGAVNDPLSLSLRRSDAEFLLCFLLTWYRDGVAEANHVDIELVGNQSVGEDCTLVVQAENSRPPIPGDEAERILRKMP